MRWRCRGRPAFFFNAHRNFRHIAKQCPPLKDLDEHPASRDPNGLCGAMRPELGAQPIQNPLRDGGHESYLGLNVEGSSNGGELRLAAVGARERACHPYHEENTASRD